MQPTLGIFLARDPWSGDQLRLESMNGYSYADNDPIFIVDPSGRYAEGQQYMEQSCNELQW